MKQKHSFLFFLIAALLSGTVLSSCSAIEGIFKAGVWAGILFVVAIIAVIIFIITRIGRRS